ncbi:MAG: HypC/HybG/HupF family hydrogenase formation chaperone [Candidatus Woesearchaeota archaeon]|nr:HypC/HybG/HupF family hydrogenase formation chaperone [Candidatus Woesearchaeota archaeon]
MCLAVEGKVLEVKNGKATVECRHQKIEAIAKDIKVKKGDKVLIQFGVVVEKLS